MKLNLRLNLNTNLARNVSIHIHRTRGASTTMGPNTNRRFPLTPEMGRADGSGDDGVACKRTSVGNPQHDEKWSNGLSVTMVRTTISRDSDASGKRKNKTNLSLSEGRQKDLRNPTPHAPRHNEQQRSNSAKGRRLDEDGHNRRVHPVFSGLSTQGSLDVPSVQDESCNDHKREEDVERNGNRKVRNAGADCQRGPNATQLRNLVDKYDSHRCICNVIWKSCHKCAEVRTHRCEVNQAREGDDPIFHGINNRATMQLEEYHIIGHPEI